MKTIRSSMRKGLALFAAVAMTATGVTAQGLLISQYTESGSIKGIEIWNNTGADIVFEATNALELIIAGNGDPAFDFTNVTVSSGTLLSGDVYVIGDDEISPTPDTLNNSLGFNGNDALLIALAGVVQDTFGLPGDDPGTSTGWASNGVQTADQNIALKTSVTTPDLDGWSDPSERFEVAGGLGTFNGFGIAPGEAPPTNVLFTAESDSALENDGTYDVIVKKTVESGNVTAEIQLGGTAVEGAGNDYTIATTNITLTGTTTQQVITVTLIDNGAADGARDLVLTLANIVGGDAASPSTFTLTINDDDTPTALIISQYTETDSGTSPKGIEIWNVSGSDITFDDSGNQLLVYKGVNGGALAIDATISTGTVVAGGVFVIGTADMTPDVEKAFTYSGDDALQITLGGVVQDTFGTPGVDPGSAWTGTNGVSTANQNIQLLGGITDGDIDGWADPSERFETVGLGSTLTGFGVAPGSAPPTNVSFTAESDTVSEDVGTYDITIIKSLASGTISGEIVLSGDATEGGGADYTVSTTNITLDGATTQQVITVIVNDDSDEETAETIVLTLVNVVGGTIASPDVFTLTINPSDVPAEGIADFRFNNNPFDQVSAQDANISVSNVMMSIGTLQTDVQTGTYFPDEPYVQSSGGWTEDNQATAKAFVFTIEPASGYKVSITGISFSAYATGAGPSAYGYDINGGAATFADDMPDSTIVHVTNAVNGVDDITVPVDILIQGWTNGTRTTAGSGDFRIDDVVIFGRVELVGGGGDTTMDEPDVTGFNESAGSFAITISVTSNGIPYSLIYSTNLLTDPAPAGTGAADTQNGDGGSIILQDATPSDPSRVYWIRSNN